MVGWGEQTGIPVLSFCIELHILHAALQYPAWLSKSRSACLAACLPVLHVLHACMLFSL